MDDMTAMCLLCGRELRSKTSIRRGFGPGCYQQWQQGASKEAQHQAKFLLSSARELISSSRKTTHLIKALETGKWNT